MKTGYIILVSVVSSVVVFFLLFLCVDRFGFFSADRQPQPAEVSTMKILGGMGNAVKDYADIALGASGMSDEEAALKMAGASLDFAGDCLQAVSGEDPFIDATASFYGAAGDVLSDPSKTKESMKKLEESVSNFIDRLF